MKIDVQAVAACNSDVWTKHSAFLSEVKTAIDALGVDYKFKIFSAGAQHSSWDSEDLLTISRKFTAGCKIGFTADTESTVTTFTNSLKTACAKVTADYYLKIRTRNHKG